MSPEVGDYISKRLDRLEDKVDKLMETRLQVGAISKNISFVVSLIVSLGTTAVGAALTAYFKSR
jgi:tetrahydromethanopterin S-methyltransferase subunit G